MKYTIKNEYLKAEISELGATLTKLIDKNSGVDLVLGFDSDEDYIRYNDCNIGATIGRNSNRIGNSRFTLNGKEYVLNANNNMNNLHGGGFNGFGFKMWKTDEVDDNHITLSYFSKDGEEGFPGNLNISVTYSLNENNLLFEFEGESDEDTIFNITNHSYFTLGDDTILDDELLITTDKYSPTDEYALTLDEVRDVKGTPYDFTQFRKLNDNLSKLEAGIDNNYVWETIGDKLMTQFRNDKLQLNLYSDLPDMHLYTAYYLGGQEGKYGKIYKPFNGLAMESQYYPNGINYGNKHLLPILKKGEKMSHFIRYEIINL
ncbi:MAG: galactose mutarotase [Erysipelotrichaceae bacterium]|nr:galactose mutarotase [Erysipelotrichaceae bacterium]